ncbi:DNA-binding protein [Aquabacter cavernae]|uniref:DNA-binding protein n=1 Tax=Aquabacter cavernae TaxID=2496029 RepID=UPI000F8C4C23|nr:DNA-binding protein [Aquabacter cavernae]
MPQSLPSGRQIAAALALLGESRADMAAASGLSEVEFAAAEAGAAGSGALDEVRRALEGAGIEFLHDGAPGVRLRPPADGIMPSDLNASNDG